MDTTALTNLKYCDSLFEYKRFKTREVTIGSIKMGGDNPIVVQSMTTTDTMDTKGTVKQCIRMIESGCELIRITAPSKKEAENLANIKAELRKLGYNTPLVADIHFTPNAAEIAAKIVEKVRVNPGNYADKKKFEVIDYTDEAYQAELDRIRERFTPLVKICKEYGTAMRIGTNHGSLSDRILSRYGDTPLGMVESAMEFLRICRDHDFHNIVISMKASNTLVMVQAYRLLVKTMIEQGMDYPLHLGVTEAGDGEDGRIKSAVGIGTLLEDGLGDTVRVSLTEEPEFEAPVARALIDRYSLRQKLQKKITTVEPTLLNPFEYKRRGTSPVENIGGSNAPVVVADLSRKTEITPASFFAAGYNYSVPLDKWNIGDMACDLIYTGKLVPDFEIPGTLGIILDYQVWEKHTDKVRMYPIISWELLKQGNCTTFSKHKNFIQLTDAEFFMHGLSMLSTVPNPVLVLETENEHAMAALRAVFFALQQQQHEIPVLVKRKYKHVTVDQLQLYASTDLGGLLIDGYSDGIWIEAPEAPLQTINSLSFGILQATRTRISKTEYISCPSCGRTLFDLQETTAKIRARTNHLKGVKIGIMGCIVNGPGEMADADYGYVGTGPGKITLYKEKEVVKKNVPSEQAVEELVNLIKEYGDWVEPKVE
ncbi:MAG: (E)-4-hydroxy-3-methylbut-2-enyl-diphosphate synthase [Luteibaculaceae bacterium]